MTIKNAGRQIKILRARYGHTQEDLAEILDVSQNFLSNVERGTKAASLELYIKIANYYKVTLDYLFSDSIDEKKNILIESINVKLKYMSEKEQRFVLHLIEAFDQYSNGKEF